MFVSVRRKLRRGDERWLHRDGPQGLPSHVSEIRSVDSRLNRYLPNDGDLECTLETADQQVEFLLNPDPNDQDDHYTLLAIDLLNDSVARVPDGWKLLGHDLADRTGWSSLHNYGPWQGRLEPLIRRLNEVGLFSLADAELARNLLPLEWPDHDHHTHPTIWALYERE